MTRDEFFNKLDVCCEETGMFNFLSCDMDEKACVYLSEDDMLYVDKVQLPYSLKNAMDIVYSADDLVDDIYIKILFSNNDFLKVTLYDDYEACIDNEKYINQKVIDKYFLLTHQKMANGYFSEKDAIQKIEQCLIKADISYFDIPGREICFNDDILHIDYDRVTPHSLQDIDDIKYYNGHKFDEENIVRIFFKSGEALDLTEYGQYEAYIKDGKVYHSYRYSEDVFKRYKTAIEITKLGIEKNEFVVVDNTLVLYNGSSKKIIVPNGIEKIENGIFENNDVKEIVFPSTLKEIGEYSFRECKNLKNIVFGEGIEKIGNRAFAGCESLEKIHLPNTVKEIHDGAFMHSLLTSINIPKMCSIGKDVFLETPYEKIYLHK